MVEHVDREVASPDFGSTLYSTSPLLVRYMIRLFIEGSPAGAMLFDETAAGTERFLTGLRPDLFPPGTQRARDGATVLTAMHLGNAVLHEQLSRRLGVSVMDGASAPRIGLVILDLYEAVGGWVTSETGVQARAAVAAYLQDLDPPTTKG